MEHWISVRDELLEPREETIRGVATRVAAMPSDLPVAFLPKVDRTAGKITVRFRYLEPDRETRTETRNEVEIKLGTDSGRVLEVEVPLTILPETQSEVLEEIQAAAALIRDALRDMATMPRVSARNRRSYLNRENALATSEVVARHRAAFDSSSRSAATAGAGAGF